KRILRYIFGTLGRGLLIRAEDLELRGFSDSDWANDKNDRKSTSGFLIFWGPNLISWCTKKQPKVSRSSTEAEYRALALLAAETIWVTYIFGNSAPLTLFLLSIVTTNQPSVWPRIPSYTPE
uniref:Ty1/Copia family ribonuclease HI n=1 Tax=Acinetobacter baumannii TaxID=470 RepID=UPI0033938FD1